MRRDVWWTPDAGERLGDRKIRVLSHEEEGGKKKKTPTREKKKKRREDRERQIAAVAARGYSARYPINKNYSATS